MSGPGTIAAMDERRGRRDLALAAVTIVGLSRLIEPPGVWFVAIFLLGAMLLGTLQVLGDETAHGDGGGLGVPIESLILPAVAAVACVGAIRLVPFGLWLAPALLVTGLIVDRTLALEARILAAHDDLGTEGRTAVLVTTLIVAFLGFTGVAATVPGGLVQPAAGASAPAAGDGSPRAGRRATPSSRSCSAIEPRRSGSRPCAMRCSRPRRMPWPSPSGPRRSARWRSHA